MWEPRRLTTLWAFTACYMDSFTFIIIISVGIAAGYGLEDRGVGVRVPVGARIICSPHHPDRFWEPSSRLSNRYRGLSRRGLKR
jgi:hypothetical protein